MMMEAAKKLPSGPGRMKTFVAARTEFYKFTREKDMSFREVTFLPKSTVEKTGSELQFCEAGQEVPPIQLGRSPILSMICEIEGR